MRARATLVAPALIALMSGGAALLSDWLGAELFMRRDTGINIAGALAINLAAVLLLVALARAVLPARALVVSLRAFALVVFAAVVLSGLRTAVGSADAIGLALRLGIVAAVAALAVAIALRAGDATAERLMRALALASLAFVAVPFAMRLASPPPRTWIGAAAQPAAPAAATLFILFDELGHAAAAPLAADLRTAGLNLRYDALDPADDGTLKVLPALFTGLPFSRARPCGMSPLPHRPGMDGTSTLDRDYATKIEQARTLVRSWVSRAASRFGSRFSIVITSDHPLRDYWCSAGVYSGGSCDTRASFRSTRVPLIVASPGPVSTRAISGNVDVFRILNDQAGVALP